MIKRILPILIAFFILYIWIKYIGGINPIIKNIKTFKILPAFYSAVFLITTFFMQSLCLKLLIDPFKKVPLVKLFYIYMSGVFLNSFAPIPHLGLAVELFLMKKLLNVPISVSGSAFLTYRIIEIISTFAFLLFLPFAKFNLPSVIKYAIAIISLIFLFFLIILILSVRMKENWLKIFDKLLFFLADKYRNALISFISSFIETFNIINKKKINLFLIMIIFLFVFPILNLFGGGFIFFSFSFDTSFMHKMVDEIGLPLLMLSVLVGQSIMNILMIIPTFIPGQIGVIQWYVSLIFCEGLGFPKDIMGTMSIFIHFFYTLVIIITGSICMLLLGIKISDLKKEMIEESKTIK